MRRSDREITDNNEIIKVIEKCDVCRIALSRNNIPYIVPMSFGYEYTDEKLILYFHCAKEGKKLDIISENPAACFEFDCSHRIIAAEKANNYTMEYESVIGSGNIIIVADSEITEKRRALSLLMRKYAPERTVEFSEAYFTDEKHFTSEMMNSVTVLKLVADYFTGKRNIK